MIQYILVFLAIYTPLFVYEQLLTIRMRTLKVRASGALKAFRVTLFITLTLFLSFLLFTM